MLIGASYFILLFLFLHNDRVYVEKDIGNFSRAIHSAQSTVVISVRAMSLQINVSNCTSTITLLLLHYWIALNSLLLNLTFTAG
ncbi:MAG TPA: hypothetical protein VHO70_13685 [Chitinispirillaceae bacterium]|nr:hypothetical protein [Chitinispirillaceae bacterium]